MDQRMDRLDSPVERYPAEDLAEPGVWDIE